MKKFFGALFLLMIFSASCSAMTFSQPVEIGSVAGNPQGGFSIKGASFINGSSYKNGQLDKQWGKLYEKGIARFGNGMNALFMHFDCSGGRKGDYWDIYSPRFGDQNAERVFSMRAGEGEAVHISQIKNNGNITLYLLCGNGPMAGTTRYVLLGRRYDGVFVKYFDVEDINTRYFGLQKNRYGTTLGMRSPWYKNCYCSGETIIITYQKMQRNHSFVNEGEFRFKWDDTAQWFSVEQIIY